MKKHAVYHLILIYCILCYTGEIRSSEIKDISREYIETWKQFFPSQTFALGFSESIFNFEDFSETKIKDWLKFNKKILNQISKHESNFTLEDRIDARLLKIQVKSEIEKWEREAPHKNSLSFYTCLISQATTIVLDSKLLMPGEKYRIILQRLDAVNNLCSTATYQLESGNFERMKRSLTDLERSLKFYKDKLPEIVIDWIEPKNHGKFVEKCRYTSSQINSLMSHVKNNLRSNLTKSDYMILGREEFTRKLRLYTDSELTPQQLEQMALEEIQDVRQLIANTSKEYLRETYSSLKISDDFDGLVDKALADMEKNHPHGEQEYLQLWTKLAKQAEEFIREKKIVSLPENQTLSIVLAPESSGPNARIGWVASAPPFQPNPWTTIYLPTIPDSNPEQDKMEFWRSFNNYFTRFIVIHELFPGHYIQNKINRENPHPVRIFFPYGLYSEGWATFCETIALNAGWDNYNKLTRLAQLRKRLENANRAYASVQAHCNGWDQGKVLEFSVTQSLLAPQFAKSLWGRLMRSPLQMTSYFLGYKKFIELYESEKKRCGEKFLLNDFMDMVLRAGPIPIDEFPHIFRNK